MSKVPSGVIILEGGFGSEKEVSLRSGKNIRKSLESWNNIKSIDPEKEGIGKIILEKPPMVINALHGTFGEDGQVQGFLDAHRIPYTGEGRLISAICFHKVMTKHILRSNAINTPAFLLLKMEHLVNKDSFVIDIEKAGITFPVILKPIEGGSSVGIQKLESLEATQEHIKNLESPIESFFIEEQIVGREVTVGILHFNGKVIILPIAEIKMLEEGLFSYEIKYKKVKSREYLLPAPLDIRKKDYLEQICHRIDRVFGFQECVRIDIIFGEDNIPYVLEINTSPGMSEGSFIPLMLQMEKISLEKFYMDRLKSLKIFK